MAFKTPIRCADGWDVDGGCPLPMVEASVEARDAAMPNPVVKRTRRCEACTPWLSLTRRAAYRVRLGLVINMNLTAQ